MSAGAGFTVRPTGSLKGGQTMWKRGMATWKTSSLLAAGGTDSQRGWFECRGILPPRDSRRNYSKVSN